MKFNATPLSLSIIQVFSTLAAIAWLILMPLTLTDILIISFGYFLLSGIGNSIFYHRYLSHKSFETYRIVEIFGIACGMLAGKGSPIDWAGMHRFHHKHADTSEDPHNPQIEGLKLFFPYLLKYDGRITPFIVRDLLKSKVYKFLMDYYLLILGIVAIVFGSINFHLFMTLWIIPMVLAGFMVSLSTYLLHKIGYQNYQLKDNSKNNLLMALLLWGEGWHNNHHAFPADHSFQKKWWEIDLGGMIIKVIRSDR